MSGLKKYNHKGKRFKKDKLKIWGGVSDNLLSYEEVNDINDFWKEDGKVKNGFCNREKEGEECIKYTLYTPKKTRNKKDIVAAHKRSTKKTNRQQSKKQIKEEL